MNLPSTGDLRLQIARVARIDASQVERLRHEALTIPRGWIAEYGDYQSGGWWTLSLLNETGRPEDVVIRDCTPVATTLLRLMPHTQRLLDGLHLRVMWARLARLAANSFLWAHTDYDELASVERYRLHVPLSTNSSAYLTMGGAKVQLRTGCIWRLTPSFQHGVCNLFGPDRIHLIIDCYADENFRRLAANAELAEDEVEPLPKLTERERERHLSVARRLLELDYVHAAETSLLRLFYSHRLEDGDVYGLIVRLYESAGRSATAEGWRRKQRMLLGEGR
jgi:hypothetical protein